MDLNADTKLFDLIKEYPFIKDFLLELSPKYKNLNNPVIFKLMSKIATLEVIANRGNFELEELISKINNRINKN